MENIGLANVFHEFVVPREFLGSARNPGKSNKFMENIGLANVFPVVFHGNSWKTLAWPMFSMNLWFSTKFHGTSQESTKFIEFMENIGLANISHEFYSFQSNLLISAVNLRSSMASRKMLSLTAQANTQEMMVVRV